MVGKQQGRGRRRGYDRYCRFWSEGGRENKDHVFTRGLRKKECISRDESILLSASSFSHDQKPENEQLIILALQKNHS